MSGLGLQHNYHNFYALPTADTTAARQISPALKQKMTVSLTEVKKNLTDINNSSLDYLLTTEALKKQIFTSDTTDASLSRADSSATRVESITKSLTIIDHMTTDLNQLITTYMNSGQGNIFFNIENTSYDKSKYLADNVNVHTKTATINGLAFRNILITNTQSAIDLLTFTLRDKNSALSKAITNIDTFLKLSYYDRETQLKIIINQAKRINNEYFNIKGDTK